MLKWRGPEIIAKVGVAAIKGVNQTMSACVIQAKQNHPGWNNRTGKAEGSVRIVRFAATSGLAVIGLWGSQNVNYVIWLELKHGSYLRNAASVEYPKLAGLIAKNFAGRVL